MEDSEFFRSTAKRELVQSPAESACTERFEMSSPVEKDTTDGDSDLDRSRSRARSFCARPAMEFIRLRRGEAKFSFANEVRFTRRAFLSSPEIKNLPSGENHTGQRISPRFANRLMSVA